MYAFAGGQPQIRR